MGCSDRYKVFVDLFNLSTFFVPRQYTPALTQRMQRSLSMIIASTDQHQYQTTGVDDDQLAEPTATLDDDDDDEEEDDVNTRNLVKLLIY